MPSSEYYRRQSETLRALALSTNDASLSSLCRSLAIEYRQLAEQTAAREALEPSTPAFRPASTRSSA